MFVLYRLIFKVPTNVINITRFVMLLATVYLFSPLRYFKVPWAYIEKKTLLMNS